MLEKESLTHNIAARLPLERIVEAHEMVEQGRSVGNVIPVPMPPHSKTDPCRASARCAATTRSLSAEARSR